MKKPYIFTIALLFISVHFTNGYAQPNNGRLSPEAYIAAFKEAAIIDMKKMGVPASITLAQGMYESDYGNSPLATNANNHFGIKCHKEWNGPTYHHDDDARDECFRKYKNVQESYDDHSDFLRSRERYQSLFNLEITDYKGWAHGLKKAGYATNPQYAHKIIDLIERYNLSDLDRNGAIVTIAGIDSKQLPEYHKTMEPESPSKIESKSTISMMNGKTTINSVPFIRAVKGDTWYKLSRANNLELWQLMDINDADKNAVLREGDYVFLKTKKNRAETEKHTVKSGETMRSIAQQYGIKMNKLYRMNHMAFDAQPKSGEVLYLNKKLFLGITLN